MRLVWEGLDSLSERGSLLAAVFGSSLTRTGRFTIITSKRKFPGRSP